MKKLLIFLPFLVFATESVPMPPMMPPMPPNINLQKAPKKTITSKKDVKKEKKETKKTTLPKECQVIPPMIIFLPPPLEDALTKCKNKLFEPKLEYAKKIFAKKKLKVKSISIVEGFNEVYEIDTNKGKFYCNRDLSKCFKVKDE